MLTKEPIISSSSQLNMSINMHKTAYCRQKDRVENRYTPNEHAYQIVSVFKDPTKDRAYCSIMFPVVFLKERKEVL